MADYPLPNTNTHAQQEDCQRQELYFVMGARVIFLLIYQALTALKTSNDFPPGSSQMLFINLFLN